MSESVLPVPYVDLSLQYKSIMDKVDKALREVLLSGTYVLGDRVRIFESELASYCGCAHAVAVGSGSDALALSLMALGVEWRDEVITTPFTFIATAAAIKRVGATPVFVDVDDETFNISPTGVHSAITANTRAIVPVHLFGLPVDMTHLLNLRRTHSLYIVEDAAQAIGGRWNGRIVGALGDAGALSFFPTKTLGGYGDGGAILSNRDDVQKIADILRRQGAVKPQVYEYIGTNSRLDTIQAAILHVKLSYLDQWLKRRRKIAAVYKELLAGTGLGLPLDGITSTHTYNQYTIRVPRDRDRLCAYLNSHQVCTAVYYRTCLHLQPAFQDLNYQEGDFPTAERLSREVLSLPCFPEITVHQQERVSSLIRRWLGSPRVC